GLTGVAPDVKFLVYKALGADGSGKDSDVIAAIERAVDPNQDGSPADHAGVVNMSLGGPASADDPVSKAVETAAEAGIVFTVAAGNSGGYYTVDAPADAPAAIAVGASDAQDHIASFSSGGPSGGTLAIKPEVVAPGVDIVSAAPGGGTIARSGTSMAAPQVAGVAALLKSIHPDWSAADIKSAIVTTAEVLPDDVMAQGGGRVDALRAASIEVIPSQNTLDFGRDDSSLSAWNATAVVRLTNRAASAVTVSATVTGTRDGVFTSVTPQTLTLDPGAAASVTITVTVDNTLLLYPRAGSLSIGGQITFTGPASPVHIPWAFVKAAHIQVRYDQDDPLWLLVSGTQTAGGAPASREAAGARSLDVYVPPNEYIAQLIASAPGSESRLFFSAPTRVDGDALLEFHHDTASNSVTFASTAPDGRPLSEVGAAPGRCEDNVIVAYPQEMGGQWIGFGTRNDRAGRFRFFATAVPESLSVVGSEICTDGVASTYIAQHGPISPRGDVTLSAAPTDWTRVPVSLAVPPEVRNPIALFGTSLIWRAAAGIIVIPELDAVPVDNARWERTLYLTQGIEGPLTWAAAVRLSGDVGKTPAFTAIDVPAIRRTNRGVTASPFLPEGPAAYITHGEEALSFGEGPPHPETAIVAVQGHLIAESNWFGSRGEPRDVEGTSVHAELRDGEGTPLSMDATLPAGKYRLEWTKPVALPAFAGEARFEADIDSSGDDPAPPSLRLLRVVDAEGVQRSTLTRGSAATLRFAAIDLVPVLRSAMLLNAPVAASMTRAWWRPHGAAAWQPLPVAIEGEDLGDPGDLGHPPAGTFFACDLSAATAAAGTIDLRLHVEDAAGNAIEYELDPAVLVAARRRAVQ
ncbi:MAG TPA: S8 family serine peptidase, partial [Thermoanaerobaculia bacterium]|nr:S8 family serine peptidase [Thermoanaerobaculia bacterium]